MGHNQAVRVNLQDMLARFDRHWSPHMVASLNDYEVKVVKVLGDFTWHSHSDTDEFFLVLSGELTIDLPDRSVVLAAGEFCVVPRGVDHRPRAEREASILLFEPSGVPNTGDAPSHRSTEDTVLHVEHDQV